MAYIIAAIFGVFFLNVITGILAGDLANKKGYNNGTHFLLGLFFGILGLIYVVGLPLKEEEK